VLLAFTLVLKLLYKVVQMNLLETTPHYVFRQTVSQTALEYLHNLFVDLLST